MLLCITEGRSIPHYTAIYRELDVGDKYDFYQVGDPCECIVPATYRHDTYLADFRKSSKKPDFYMAEAINKETYPFASQHLVAGMRLLLTMYGIEADNPVRISKCMVFLRDSGGVFTNAHGLAISYELCPEMFAPGFTYYGLDLPAMLPEDRLEAGNVVKIGFRHPMIYVPNTRTPMPTSFSHTFTQRFSSLARFLKYEILEEPV